VKVHGHVVISVDAGSTDYVYLGLGSYTFYARDIAPEAYHREIDDRIDACCFQLVQPRYGVGDAFFFVAPRARIVLHDLRREHKDVLVHKRHAKLGQRDRAPNSIYRSHISSTTIRRHYDERP
jgi:hypothetical protein